MIEETERERFLHAMYDALKDLEESGFEGAAAPILRGVLRNADYPPYLNKLVREENIDE
jgi:hypothetical protein